MTLQEMIAEIPTLSIAERKQLIYQLVDSLGEANQAKSHRALEFAGIGAELADGIDAQDHLRELRDEWNQRP